VAHLDRGNGVVSGASTRERYLARRDEHRTQPFGQAVSRGVEREVYWLGRACDTVHNAVNMA